MNKAYTVFKGAKNHQIQLHSLLTAQLCHGGLGTEQLRMDLPLSKMRKTTG